MAKRGYQSEKTGSKVDELLDKIDNLNVPEWALQESKPSYTAQEVHALPENTSIPRNTSDLTNDMGYISHESDPTVPSWAKQPTKPAYTAEEVGALPSDTPVFSGDYNDLRNKPIIPTVPENVSAFNNDAGYLTSHQDISGKEDKSNKVTSLSAQSTDTQYPSAKAVYDELESKQDTINDLSTIRSGASAGATAYQKPQAGIPENDLSQGVKDKMNEKEVFWATYGQTTAAEIDAAVAAGKEVLCLKDDRVYQLVINASNLTYIQFFAMLDTSVTYLRLKRSNNAWDSTTNSFQKTSDRVTAFQSTPDNTHYPSEKLVKDSLDTKAEVGDILFANFSRLTPKKTFEYDVSDTAYHPLFSRANTGISQLMSEVDDIVKFRITVTGTNIYARVDVVVRFQPSLTPPAIMAWNEPHSTTLSTTGLFTLSNYYPKVLNSGNGWYLLFNTYNNTARHIKVEVYEDTENIAWIETKEELTYISSNWSVSGLEMHSTVGLGTNLSWRLKDASVSNSIYAQYLNVHLDTWISNTMPIAGEALVKNGLVVMSGQKLFKATNKTVPVDCDCGVMLCINSNVAVNSAPAFSSISQKYSWLILTGDPALTKDTFARGDQVYLRCTLGQDGKIYPDGHLSNVKSAGYTWVHIGTAASATAINLDTCGKPFITLNNDGKVTHINGTAVMDSSMSKWGVVSQTQTWTNDYHSYTLSDVTYGYIPQEFIDRWKMLVTDFGGTFNKTTGYFELNGLTDLTYQDAIIIVNQYSPFLQNEGWRPNSAQCSEYKKFKARTCIPNTVIGAAIYPYLTHNRYIEVVRFSVIPILEFTSFIQYGCFRLKKLLDIIKYNADISLTYWYALEECYFKLTKNFSAPNSKYLSLTSIVYMVENATNTSAITITLHADAYARCQADTTEYTYSGQTYTGILALATAKNITIAT